MQSEEAFQALVGRIYDAALDPTMWPEVMVFVSDPETTAGRPTHNLCRFSGLTEREAHLAVAIAQGLSVADYADENEVSTNTVRWHLKQIQSKTDSRRQTDIVRLVLSVPTVTAET